MKKTRIVLADDHTIVREGLRSLLETQKDFQVVGEASDGLETLSLIEQTKPDVLVVDIMMPNLSGLEITRQAAQRSPGIRVVVLSMHGSEAYVVEALHAGASGYVLKRASTAELVVAIREAVAGRRYLSSPLSNRLIDAFIRKYEKEDLELFHTLTTREREVLHLVAEGYTHNQIADKLFISSRTVERHRANLMHKLGLKSHTDLIRYAFKRGILPLDGET